MKIYTLGTGHGNSTLSRFNSSTLYETEDGTLYLVDAGAPVEALIRRKGLEIKDVRAVFVSHMHDDHAGGLTGLMKQVIKYPAGRTFPLTVHLPEERAIGALKAWFSAVHEDAEHEFLEFRTTNDGAVYEDDNLKVSAIRTCHLRTRGRTEGDPCSFAYVLHFKKEDMTVLHTGDLRPDFSDYPAIAMEQHPESAMWEIGSLDAVTGETAFRYSETDATAKAVVDGYVRALACGITNLANELRPEAVILGGGVCAEGKRLTDPLQAILDEEIFAGTDGPAVPILTAELANRAGILGAAALLLEN